MQTYTPDTWVVLQFETDKRIICKVFAGWYGGYTQGDSWKLNSGIKQIRHDGDWMEFDGYSGSIYRCGISNYHMSGLMHGILSRWQEQAVDQGVTIKILTLDQVLDICYNCC